MSVNNISSTSSTNSTNNSKPADMKAQIDSQLKAAGATDAEIQAAAANGPAGISALASKLGVTLPQPPAPPEGNIFEGDKKTGKLGDNPMKAQMDAKLKEAGATDAEIQTAQQSGKEGMKALFEKYNIAPPPKPNNKDGDANSGNKLNVNA